MEEEEDYQEEKLSHDHDQSQMVEELSESNKDEVEEEEEEEEEQEEEEETFPDGMLVLAVDDNIVCLTLLQAVLQRCRYKVKIASDGATALKLLLEEKTKFDIVITDVHMPDMDGFKLLEIVSLELDIPVIMMSANDDKNMVMKGIQHGARDYLVKPIRKEEIQNIWQHVIRKNLFQPNESVLKKEITDQNSKSTKRQRGQSKEKESILNNDSGEDISTHKRPRVVWTHKLHTKFIDAVKEIGVEKAVPKKILEHMNEPGLSRENIASHLQKFRNALKKNSTAATTSQQSSNNVDHSNGGISGHLSSITTITSNDHPNDLDHAAAKIRISTTHHPAHSFHHHEVNGYNKNLGIHQYGQSPIQNSCFFGISPPTNPFLQVPETVDQMLLRERKHIPRHIPRLAGDFSSSTSSSSSNPLRIPHHLTDFSTNGLHKQYQQSFSRPRTTLFNGRYMEVHPHIPLVYSPATNGLGLTGTPGDLGLDYKSATTSYPPNLCFNGGGSSITASSTTMPTVDASTHQLSSIVPNDSSITYQPLQNNFLSSGQTIPDHIQSISAGMDNDVMLSDIMKSINNHQTADLETEISIDEDLHAAIRQFQQ